MIWGALLGGLIGAGIPGVLTYAKLRRDRQALDAEVFGPAVLLLRRIDPMRLAVNIQDAETETARMQDLARQVDTASERLLVVSAGHPRRRVRRLAEEAETKLASALQASGWQVRDMLRPRDDGGAWMKHAQETHAEATTAVRELIRANFTWIPFRR